MKLIGPFSQMLTLDNLLFKGLIQDNKLEVIENGGVIVDKGFIVKTGLFDELLPEYRTIQVEEIQGRNVLLPGFVDCHTHTCFAGSRAMDFAERNGGSTYLDIAQKGGGIWSTVQATRNIKDMDLKTLTEARVEKFLNDGITTLEIKSGYGLSVQDEIKMLRIINELNTKVDVIPTCLAAHIKPKDFDGSHSDYLNHLVVNLLPEIKHLTNRVDIFIEKSAFGMEEAKQYMLMAQAMGYKLTVHADQFTPSSSQIAVDLNALSADHLEASSESDIKSLANSETVAVALPGASIGLGEQFAPARKLLVAGACLAIASDYNPGSAPMGNLLCQASILATFEKLSTAEVFAGLTFRAAKALDIFDIGRIKSGYKADLQCYPANDYREILYHQGSMKPVLVWKNGEKIN